MIKKILIEWSYRLDDGIINLNNPKHMLILSEVLKDMKLPTKVILEVMGNLTEKKKSTPLSQKDKDKMKKAVDNRDWYEAAYEMTDSKWSKQVPNRAMRLVEEMKSLGEST